MKVLSTFLQYFAEILCLKIGLIYLYNLENVAKLQSSQTGYLKEMTINVSLKDYYLITV